MTHHQTGLRRGWIGGLAVGFLLPAIASASLLLPYERTISKTNGAQGLVRPVAVSIDPVGAEVCVTDAGSPSLHVCNLSGIPVFRTTGGFEMSSPQDGSLDSSGGFVFTDVVSGGVGRTIKRLNFLGELETYDPESPREAWRPSHLLVTRDGDYVTLDVQVGMMAKHDAATGALLWTRELPGTENGLTELVGRPAESPDGRLYVPGGRLKSVLVFSADGEFLTSFGKAGSVKGHFNVPIGIAFGPRETVLVLDRLRHKILLFGPDHEFMGEFGSFGSCPGCLYHPASIAASPDGRVFVAQGYGGRVQIYRFVDSDAELSASSRGVVPVE